MPDYDHSIEPIDLGIPGLTNIERIGSGGNAVVYRALQADLDRNVVVKVLANVDAETTRRRFDRERRAMGRLSQAVGIAPLYGTGYTPAGQPYLLMPFYEMGSLQDHLERSGALDPRRVRDLGVSMSRAVQSAHENGVLHRDIKPANILLRRSGQADVADFGIAHLTDDLHGTSQALTMTPLYTAPEVFDGIDSGVASDVYSLGATLFALLNGRAAHADTDGTPPMLSLIRRVNEDPLPELPAEVPQGLVDVVTKAMSKDPTQRHATAGELAAELAAADMTVTPTKQGQASRRSPVVVLAIVAVLLAAVGGAAAAFYLIGGDDDPDDDDAEVVTPTTVATSPPDTDATPGPTSEATATPTTEESEFDSTAATAAADQVLVRIEAFACSGADVATGVVLNDGIVVTEASVLESPWWIDVIADGDVLRSTPAMVHTTEDLSFVLVDDATALSELPGVAVSGGDQVAFVGIDGRPAVATLFEQGGALVAELATPSDGNAVEIGDAVVTDSGGLAGVAGVTPGRIEVITPERIDSDGTGQPPSYDCDGDRRELGANDVESAVSPAVSELLAMQRLSNAYATERWDLVRRLEPAKAPLSDENFVDGWRPLREGFIFPVDRSIDADGLAAWRIALVGHETWSGTDLTTLFCVSWTVDDASGDIVQTNEETVLVYGSQPGQPQRLGFVDPGELRPLIQQNCPLDG